MTSSKRVLRDELQTAKASLDSTFGEFQKKLELQLPFVRVNVTRVQKIHHRYRRGPRGGIKRGGECASPTNGGGSGPKAR